jgi:hypothetical protein
MISNPPGSIDREVVRHQERPGDGVSYWLALAATPAFAIMALLTGVHDVSIPDMLCSATRDASPLSGMAPMYWLMSAFHLAPWLRLLVGRGSGARGIDSIVHTAK